MTDGPTLYYIHINKLLTVFKNFLASSENIFFGFNRFIHEPFVCLKMLLVIILIYVWCHISLSFALYYLDHISLTFNWLVYYLRALDQHSMYETGLHPRPIQHRQMSCYEHYNRVSTWKMQQQRGFMLKGNYGPSLNLLIIQVRLTEFMRWKILSLKTWATESNLSLVTLTTPSCLNYASIFFAKWKVHYIQWEFLCRISEAYERMPFIHPVLTKRKKKLKRKKGENNLLA